jgi:hypothetical protein
MKRWAHIFSRERIFFRLALFLEYLSLFLPIPLSQYLSSRTHDFYGHPSRYGVRHSHHHNLQRLRYEGDSQSRRTPFLFHHRSFYIFSTPSFTSPFFYNTQHKNISKRSSSIKIKMVVKNIIPHFWSNLISPHFSTISLYVSLIVSFTLL